jgi:hypothetical protein
MRPGDPRIDFEAVFLAFFGGAKEKNFSGMLSAVTGAGV